MRESLQKLRRKRAATAARKGPIGPQGAQGAPGATWGPRGPHGAPWGPMGPMGPLGAAAAPSSGSRTGLSSLFFKNFHFFVILGRKMIEKKVEIWPRDHAGCIRAGILSGTPWSDRKKVAWRPQSGQIQCFWGSPGV